MTNDAELGGNMAWRNICVINDYTCNKRLWTEMITNATWHGIFVSEMMGCTKDRRLRRVMITNATW